MCEYHMATLRPWQMRFLPELRGHKDSRITAQRNGAIWKTLQRPEGQVNLYSRACIVALQKKKKIKESNPLKTSSLALEKLEVVPFFVDIIFPTMIS